MRVLLVVLLLPACAPPPEAAGGGTDGATDSEAVDTEAPDTDAADAEPWCLPGEGVFRTCDPGIRLERWWSDIIPDPFTSDDEREWVPWEGYTAALQDFDGDGDLDVLLGGQPGSLGLWLATPSGFVPTPIEGVEVPWVLAIAADDLDADGEAEAVVYGTRATRAEIRDIETAYADDGFNEGDNDLLAARAYFLERTDDGRFVLGPGEPHGLGDTSYMVNASFADLTGDGRVDLYLTTREDCPSRAYRAVGPAKWVADTSLVPEGLRSNAVTAVIDIEEDGHLEMLTGSYAGFGAEDNAVWRRRRGVWTADRISPFDGIEGVALMGAAFLDADLDGEIDLYADDIGRQHLRLLPPRSFDGTDVGAASGALELATVDGWDLPIAWGARAVDLDGDRDHDLVATSGFERYSEDWDQQLLLHWHEGLDANRLPRFVRDLSGDVVTATHERGLVIADVTGDGWPDLLPLPTGGLPFRVLANPGGPGAPPRFVAVRYPSGHGAEGARVRAVYDDGTVVAHVATGSSGFVGTSPVGVWVAMEGLDHVEAHALTAADAESRSVVAAELGTVLVLEP